MLAQGCTACKHRRSPVYPSQSCRSHRRRPFCPLSHPSSHRTRCHQGRRWVTLVHTRCTGRARCFRRHCLRTSSMRCSNRTTASCMCRSARPHYCWACTENNHCSWCTWIRRSTALGAHWGQMSRRRSSQVIERRIVRNL